MKINIVHIHNDQALQVKVSRFTNDWENWKTYMQNNARFGYENARLNGMEMREVPIEMLEAMQGNY